MENHLEDLYVNNIIFRIDERLVPWICKSERVLIFALALIVCLGTCVSIPFSSSAQENKDPWEKPPRTLSSKRLGATPKKQGSITQPSKSAVPSRRYNVGVAKIQKSNTQISIRYQFNSARIFLIELEQNIYQVGVVAKIINLTDSTYEINNVVINKGELGITSRATNYIQVIYNRVFYPIIQDSNVVYPNSANYIKLLTPIKIQLLNNGNTLAPELIFTGDWCVESMGTKSITTCSNMKYYATYEKYITINDWNKILKPSTSINIEDISLKLAPINVDLKSPAKYYLLWNADSSAKIKIYGFSESIYVKSSNGTIVFVAGNGNLNLENGWVILGSSYKEVWSDQYKLMLYNSIYPPSETGEPRAFAAFAGVEESMGVNAPVPTTRAATFLHVPLLDPMKWKQGKTRGQENVSFMDITP